MSLHEVHNLNGSGKPSFYLGAFALVIGWLVSGLRLWVRKYMVNAFGLEDAFAILAWV
jgi:hypothetical protein